LWAKRAIGSLKNQQKERRVVMTQQVADEVLGKIARQENDLFRRVREGTLNPESVSRGLQDLIEGRFTNNVSYFITINYDLSVEEAVRAGKYDWSNSDITTKHFPSKRKGTAEVEVILVHFNRAIESDEAVRELDRMGLRPAELPEGLAFGAKYPDTQREFPIVILGSVWQNPPGLRGCAYLCRGGSERGLNLDWFVHKWNSHCRFAALRK